MTRYPHPVPLFDALTALSNPAALATRFSDGCQGFADAAEPRDAVELSTDGVQWFVVAGTRGGSAGIDIRACASAADGRLPATEPAAATDDAVVVAPLSLREPGTLVLMVGGRLAAGRMRAHRAAQR